MFSLALLSGTSTASVYKCETPSGQVAYQAAPCAKASKQSEVKIRPARPTSTKSAELPNNSDASEADIASEQPRPSFRVQDGSGEVQVQIPNDFGGFSYVSLSSVERIVAEREKQLEQALRCDEQHEKRLEEWEKRKEANLQKALADCERRRNSYCDTRDPQKILRLYNHRNNPNLDVPNDPVLAGMKIAEADENRRIQELRMRSNTCPYQGVRDRWQRELNRYQKALAAVD